jgi:glycosyltransferase involved in cell wall biosynthesis
MDFFVMPSLEDNLPQTGIEAMACGLPVVAFDTGGIPDYVQPLETGLLARVGDASALSEQINWLADRPADRVRMGRNARSFVAREFAAHVQANRYIELYESLIDHRHEERNRQNAA